jgi:C-terminal processing protease CtpA/Prc
MMDDKIFRVLNKAGNYPMKNRREIPAIAGLLMCVLFACPMAMAQQPPAQQQTVLTKDEQYQISGILRDAYNDVKKYYYDPKMHGLDWDARYKQYTAKIGTTRNLGEGFRLVAAFLGGLKDSHVFFMPPERNNQYDPGYKIELVGNDGFITQIRPKSDAESKLHIGDLVEKHTGYNLNREDFFDLRYYYTTLAPKPAVELVLRSPDGAERTSVVYSKVKVGKRIYDGLEGYYHELDQYREYENEDHATRSRIVEKGDVAIWKLHQFFLDEGEVGRTIRTASKHKTLILDLRGNPGGSVDTLKEVVGSLFDREIKIGDRVTRKETKPMLAKRQSAQFTGKVIVLVDASCASAAEILARVVQLEHRGTVIGDKTSGKVMESLQYIEKQNGGTVFAYGFSITDADLIMSDGHSLEKTGVQPDEVLLPTGADLAAGRDPVLAHAAELAGIKLDPAEAGKMFPYEWPPI